jgi:hypothetical protein
VRGYGSQPSKKPAEEAGGGMVISHKFRFIFVKNLKVAGTSLEAYLSPLCGERDIFTPIHPPVEGHQARNARGFYNHMPAHEIRTRVSERLWNSYYRFTIERNPWDKTLSHYAMERHYAGDNLSFDDYLAREELINTHFIYTDPLDDSLLVDRVLSYERLEEELSEVFAQLDVPFDDGLNVHAKAGYRQDRRPYRKIYNAAQRQRVTEVFDWEIKHLGYEF